jgi:hypothetical protein
MVDEADRFKKELIDEKRALGELEHSCLTESAQIETSEGWKYIKDIRDDEIVKTLNIETKREEYHKIDKKIDEPYKGKMIGVKNESINTLVTPNHRFLLGNISKQLFFYKTAEEVFSGFSGFNVVDGNRKISVSFDEFYEEEFDGRVYCVSVKNKNFLCKDNGKIFWTGNSEPTVNSERACHMITELRQDGNTFYGKSKVLSSTPMGSLFRGLIMDGVKMGMSTRALGQLHEDAGFSRVSDFKLITVDAVADPSAPGAFVDGILESKEWVLSEHGHLEEYYLGLEKRLGRLPKKDLESFLKEQITDFIKNLK